jgi:hypothetical protein
VPERSSAGISWVEQLGDYANPIPTTSAMGPADLAGLGHRHSVANLPLIGSRGWQERSPAPLQ